MCSYDFSTFFSSLGGHIDGLCLSHGTLGLELRTKSFTHDTPTPKNNIKNNIVLQELDFHKILPLVGGTYEIGPLR
jgi:hypothetical protein